MELQMTQIAETTGKVYDTRHGGPYDRGSADSYYGRRRNPHYYVGGTGHSKPITKLTAQEREAYNAGYNDNEAAGDKKS
jgi:hypothetical protein